VARVDAVISGQMTASVVDWAIQSHGKISKGFPFVQQQLMFLNINCCRNAIAAGELMFLCSYVACTYMVCKQPLSE
jgi:hypothetical protein